MKDGMTTQVETLLSDPLSAMGYGLVRVQMLRPQPKTRILQVMAERLDGGHLTIKDCEDISKTASALLDVEDIVSDRYILEVSSPGVNRPLLKIEDYNRFAGELAKVETAIELHGRRKFRGVLKGLQDDQVMMELETEKETVSIPFADIRKANLVFTDEQMKADLRKGKQ